MQEGKKGGKSWEPRECPKNWKAMCEALNAWAEEWKDWGEIVQRELNKLIPGPPGHVPDPPDPPFGP